MVIACCYQRFQKYKKEGEFVTKKAYISYIKEIIRNNPNKETKVIANVYACPIITTLCEFT
jgi:hypothetical protein